MPVLVQALMALAFVLALVAVIFFIVRRLGGKSAGASAGRGRQPRLGVLDVANVDGRRRLVIIRRDSVEHLLMIGGPNDVVIESNIVRSLPAGQMREERAAPPVAEEAEMIAPAHTPAAARARHEPALRTEPAESMSLGDKMPLRDLPALSTSKPPVKLSPAPAALPVEPASRPDPAQPLRIPEARPFNPIVRPQPLPPAKPMIVQTPVNRPPTDTPPPLSPAPLAVGSLAAPPPAMPPLAAPPLGGESLGADAPKAPPAFSMPASPASPPSTAPSAPPAPPEPVAPFPPSDPSDLESEMASILGRLAAPPKK